MNIRIEFGEKVTDTVATVTTQRKKFRWFGEVLTTVRKFKCYRADALMGGMWYDIDSGEHLAPDVDLCSAINREAEAQAHIQGKKK